MTDTIQCDALSLFLKHETIELAKTSSPSKLYAGSPLSLSHIMIIPVLVVILRCPLFEDHDFGINCYTE